MKYFLKHITEFTWVTGIFLSLSALCMFVPDLLLPEHALWQTITTILLTIGNAVVLMHLLYQVGVTRTRSYLPVFCYILLVGAIAQLHSQWEGQLVVLALQAVILLLMRAYRSENAVHESFLGSLILCIAALLMPDMLFLLPVLWIGLLLQRAMNLRVFLASLIGIGIFVLYVWISSLLFSDVFAVMSLKDAFLHTLPASEGIIPLLFIALFAMVYGIISIIGFARENSRAQSLVLVLLILLLLSVVMMFFPPQYFISLLPVAVYSVAALSAYCFCSKQSVTMGVIFILYLLFAIGIYVISFLHLI